jgi:protease stability complex PrcB-like protein
MVVANAAVYTVCTVSTAVNFTTIARGAMSGVTSPEEIVVQSVQEWHALWTRHAPNTPEPVIDFTKEIVVGVFAGQRPTGGYRVQITSIERSDAGLTVVYDVTQPAKDAMVTQALTSPFELVRIPRLQLPVRFERKQPSRT